MSEGEMLNFLQLLLSQRHRVEKGIRRTLCNQEYGVFTLGMFIFSFGYLIIFLSQYQIWGWRVV